MNSVSGKSSPRRYRVSVWGPIAAMAMALTWGAGASAQDLLPTLPQFGSDPLQLTVDSAVMGRGCLMVPGTDLGLACNPALLADSRITQFRANIFIDQGLNRVEKQYHLVQNQDHMGILDDLLKNPGPAMARGAINLWYQWENWAFTFTPARLRYAVADKNPAYPEIAAYIRKDTELAWSAGYHVVNDPRFRVGWNLRYHWSDVMHEQFAVLDAIADPSVIKVGKQSGLLVEPAIAYEFDRDTHANLVAAVTGLELFRSGMSEGNAQPLGDIGLTIRPEWEGVRWTLGAQMTALGDMSMSRRWRLTSLVEWEYVNFSSTIAMGEIGLGLSTAIDSLTLGLGYMSRDFSNSSTWGSHPAQDLMFEVGLRF